MIHSFKEDSLCKKHGDKYEAEGDTARTACCACGGGETHYNPSPSDFPSYSPTASPTVSVNPAVSSHPTGAAYGDELNALISLFNSTKGTGWSESENWLSDRVSFCEWRGVSCNKNNGRVEGIELSDNNLSGTT